MTTKIRKDQYFDISIGLSLSCNSSFFENCFFYLKMVSFHLSFFFVQKSSFLFKNISWDCLRTFRAEMKKNNLNEKKSQQNIFHLKGETAKAISFLFAWTEKKLEIKVFGFPLKFNSMFNPKTRKELNFRMISFEKHLAWKTF